MKKSKNLLIFGLIPLMSLPVLAISCNSNKTINNNETIANKENGFDPKTTWTNKKLKSERWLNIFNGNRNNNATKIIKNIVNSLDVKILNKDFQKILNRFYEVYEIDYENNLIEIEAEIKDNGMKIVKKNSDGTFDLQITAEVEIDNERDREVQKTETIKWKPRLTLISKDDVEKIKEKTKNFTKVTNSKDGNEIDFSDLKEIFLGKKDDDDIDDLGIFDILEKTNKNYHNLAYLISYKLSLSDLDEFYKKIGMKRKSQYNNIDKNTEFYIPSVAINKTAMTLFPNWRPDFKINRKSEKNTSELIELVTTEKGAISTETEMVELIKKLGINTNIDGLDETKTVEIVIKEKNIKSIEFHKDDIGSTTDFILIFNYKNDKKTSDAFYISPKDAELYKPVVLPLDLKE